MTTAWRVVACVAVVALVVVYAAGSGVWVSTNPDWYEALTRPSWQPPDIVFGLIWPYNFVALTVVGIIVALRGTPGIVAAWLVVAAASIACALAWAYLFYIEHQLPASAVALACAALLTLVLLILTWSVTRGGAIALVPYLIWVSLATSLAVGYARLNA